MNYLRDKLKAMLMSSPNEEDNAWWSGKLFTQATDEMGGYVKRVDGFFYNITNNTIQTISTSSLLFLKIPKGATTLTINSFNTTYGLTAENRQGMGYFNEFDIPVIAGVTCNDIIPVKTIELKKGFKYIAISARNNIFSIRNNTTFEFSK